MPFRFRSLLLGSLIGVLFYSCIKEDISFDGFTTSNWKPDVALPLVNSTLSFADVSGLTDSGEVYVDQNGRIVVVSTSSLYERRADEFITIPDQTNTSSLVISNSILTQLPTVGSSYQQVVSNSYSFDAGSGVQLSSMLIKSGSLEIAFSNPTPLQGSVDILINELSTLIGSSITPFFKSVPLPANVTNGLLSVDLSGYTLAPTSNNTISIAYGFNLSRSGIAPALNSVISVSATFKDITYYHVYGYFGSQGFQIPLDSARLNLYTNNPSDDFTFLDPSVNLEITNGVGESFTVSSIFLQPLTASGSPIPFSTTLNSFSISSPSTPGQEAVSVATINNSNSTIVQVMQQRPEYVTYLASVNTANPTGTLNFITDSSRFNARLRVELPLDGYAQRYTIKDTAEFALEDIDQVDSMVFRLDIRNGFPASAYSQVYFADSNGVVLDSLLLDPMDRLIDAADVDANGYVIRATERIHDEPFNRARIQRITECTQLFVYSLLNTPNASQQQRVVFTDRDQLSVKLGVRARLNVSTQ